MFIEKENILSILNRNENASESEIKSISEKARQTIKLSLDEVAKLINCNDDKVWDEINKIAMELKEKIYGGRIVMFAPLYVSDFCVNNCTYCGYKRDNVFDRKKLDRNKIMNEVSQLEKIGHKRLALELGEHPTENGIDYVCEAIDAIYSAGTIRRINVNIAPVSVDEFKRLHEANIGTYILFQETYDKDVYEKYHPLSLKGDYTRQLYAHHNAMEGGIEDVGGGVLYGLADWKFDLLAQVKHNDELESKFGVGFHTVSVPRLKVAEGVNITDYPHIVSDKEFERIVALLRIAVPFAGIILSTRENMAMREKLLKLGVSQISSGSQTGVGGYCDNDGHIQFETEDNRGPLETIKWLIKSGYIPSFCTACYRMGRTGNHFMEIVKAGQIHEMCTPNALITLYEYGLDYGDDELMELINSLIDSKMKLIDNVAIKNKVEDSFEKLRNGVRDLYV